MQRIFWLLSLIMFSQIALAEQCPSSKDIQKNRMHGFKLYDSDDGKRLSLNRLRQFRKNIDQFTMVEWQDTKDHLGAVHCYYRDRNGSAMEAFLMKDKLQPIDNKHRWYQVSGSMHCAASSGECQFRQSIKPNTHLAKKTTKGLRDVFTRH